MQFSCANGEVHRRIAHFLDHIIRQKELCTLASPDVHQKKCKDTAFGLWKSIKVLEQLYFKLVLNAIRAGLRKVDIKT